MKKGPAEKLMSYSAPYFVGSKFLLQFRAAQCIDKEILINKNGNIDIDIEIDKRVFL